MHRLAPALLFLLFVSITCSASQLISHELIRSYDREELIEEMKKHGIPQFLFKIENGVDVYEVVYKGKYVDGSMVRASGLYYVPKIEGEEFPVVAYHHGTRIKIERSTELKGENIICMAFAVGGYAVTMPDYFGLGKGERKHIYQHCDSEAQASMDMIRAVKELNPKLGVKLKNELYITGYSQGGHAAMSLHKVIQEDFADEFTVKASSPMSGAYDMSGVQSEVMFEEYSHPGYLPYLIFSYDIAYDIWDGNVAEVLVEPLDSIIPPLFDGKHSMGYINKHLPKVPGDMVKEEFIDQYKNNPDFPFLVKLKENDVYDWKPEAPMQLCYCNADEQVSYRNSIVAYEAMKKNGAERVIKRNGGKKYGHNTCAIFSAIYTKMWFDSVRKGKKGRKGPVFKRWMVGLAKIKIKNIDR